MNLGRQQFDVVVFGAEKQAAVSAALSRPDLHFLFVSDQNVIDGWDLTNVTIYNDATKAAVAALEHSAPRQLVLSAAWSAVWRRSAELYRLSSIMKRLVSAFPDDVLTVQALPSDEPWILKGDAWHRPDAPIEGEGLSDGLPTSDCGEVYQRRLDARQCILTTGRREESGASLIGTVAVHHEAMAREDFLLAGESIEKTALVDLSRAMLDEIGHCGHYSMNWVRDVEGKFWLTSFRPVPRSLFQLFRSGGLDLLEPAKENKVLPAGRRFVVDYHYASYQ